MGSAPMLAPAGETSSDRAASARHGAVWLWATFLVARTAVLISVAGRGTDLGVHAGYAAQVAAGRVPFRDFSPEYPPLTFVFTCLPVLVDPSLRHYFPLFRSLCCTTDLLAWVLVLRLTRARAAP